MRGPGQRDRDTSRRVLDQDAGRGPGEAEHHGARRNRRLLADALRKVGVGPAEPLCDSPVTRPRSPGRAADPRAAAARDPGQQLDRPVVVRRAETPGQMQTSASRPSAIASSRSSTLSPTTTMRAGLDTEPDELGGDERPVGVAAVPAHELRARDDDDGARTRWHARRRFRDRRPPLRRVGRLEPSALATRTAGPRTETSFTRLPSSSNSRFLGFELRARARRRGTPGSCPRCNVPSHPSSPSAEPSGTSTCEGPRAAVTISTTGSVPGADGGASAPVGADPQAAVGRGPVSAPSVVEPNRQAAMTSTVTATIPTRASNTACDSARADENGRAAATRSPAPRRRRSGS